jgi:hypothetical protein
VSAIQRIVVAVLPRPLRNSGRNLRNRHLGMKRGQTPEQALIDAFSGKTPLL